MTFSSWKSLESNWPVVPPTREHRVHFAGAGVQLLLHVAQKCDHAGVSPPQRCSHPCLLVTLVTRDTSEHVCGAGLHGRRSPAHPQQWAVRLGADGPFSTSDLSVAEGQVHFLLFSSLRRSQSVPGGRPKEKLWQRYHFQTPLFLSPEELNDIALFQEILQGLPLSPEAVGDGKKRTASAHCGSPQSSLGALEPKTLLKWLQRL